MWPFPSPRLGCILYDWTHEERFDLYQHQQQESAATADSHSEIWYVCRQTFSARNGDTLHRWRGPPTLLEGVRHLYNNHLSVVRERARTRGTKYEARAHVRFLKKNTRDFLFFFFFFFGRNEQWVCVCLCERDCLPDFCSLVVGGLFWYVSFLFRLSCKS